MWLTALTCHEHMQHTLWQPSIMRMLLFDTVILCKSRTYRCRVFILTLRASMTRSLASSSPSMMLRRVRSSGLLRLSMFSSHFWKTEQEDEPCNRKMTLHFSDGLSDPWQRRCWVGTNLTAHSITFFFTEILTN